MKRPNESIYTFPCPDCMCRLNRTEHSKPKHSRQYFIIAIPQTNPIIFGIQFFIILHVLCGPSFLHMQSILDTALNINLFSQILTIHRLTVNLNSRSNTSRLLSIVNEVSHSLGQYCSCTWFISSLSSCTNFEWKTDIVNFFIILLKQMGLLQQSACILVASSSVLYLSLTLVFTIITMEGAKWHLILSLSLQMKVIC